MHKKLIVILGAALLSGALGCSKDSGGGNSDCDAVGVRIKAQAAAKADQAPAEIKDKIAGAMDGIAAAAVNRCKADGWSKEATDCAKNADDPKTCQDKLTDDQRKKLNDDMLKAAGQAGLGGLKN